MSKHHYRQHTLIRHVVYKAGHDVDPDDATSTKTLRHSRHAGPTARMAKLLLAGATVTSFRINRLFNFSTDRPIGFLQTDARTESDLARNGV